MSIAKLISAWLEADDIETCLLRHDQPRAFPKGFNSNKAMNPTNGPATLAEASRPPGEGARQVRPGMS
jgi:hypothetical protein